MSMRSFAASIPRILLFLLAPLALAACGTKTDTSPDVDDTARREARELRLAPRKVDINALKKQVTDIRARRFYQTRGWQPAWDSAMAARLLEALGDSERHALSRSMFFKVSPRSGPVEKEAALTEAA